MVSEKEVKNIRKRKSYKEMATTLRWLEAKPDIIDILKKIYPPGCNSHWHVEETLEQLLKDYEDERKSAKTGHSYQERG